MRERSMIFADGGEWDKMEIEKLTDEELMDKLWDKKILEDSIAKKFVLRDNAKIIYRGPFVAFGIERDELHQIIIEQEEGEQEELNRIKNWLSKRYEETGECQCATCQAVREEWLVQNAEEE
jgi:hypothetical protein